MWQQYVYVYIYIYIAYVCIYIYMYIGAIQTLATEHVLLWIHLFFVQQRMLREYVDCISQTMNNKAEL